MFRIKLPDRDKPLPEEEIIDDRGETKYFHGRENEKKYILRLLFRSSPGKKGSCFLVQGPPGVGKTAFLAECRKWAEEKGWGTAEIRPGALWDTDILWECLGKAKRRLKRISAEVGIDITSIGVSLDLDRDASTPIKALQGKDAPLLLILDEAQRFGNPTLIPAGKQELVTSLLDYIHNGKMDRPLVLLVGGLGNTRSVFEGVLGISRFKSNCYFNLEALSRAEERGVIKDWLTEEGKAKGDITGWVDAITAETHGWGHHIASCLDPALEYLKESEGEMTEEGLRIVMEQGRVNRREYYRGRTEDLSYNEFNGLVELFQHVSLEIGLTDEEIKRAIGEGGFDRALSKGVLHKKERRYIIPIPSLQDYMIREWLAEKELTVREQSYLKQVSGKETGKEFPPKEPENHKADSPFPEKEEGKIKTEQESISTEQRRPGQGAKHRYGNGEVISHCSHSLV